MSTETTTEQPLPGNQRTETARPLEARMLLRKRRPLLLLETLEGPLKWPLQKKAFPLRDKLCDPYLLQVPSKDFARTSSVFLAPAIHGSGVCNLTLKAGTSGRTLRIYSKSLI